MGNDEVYRDVQYALRWLDKRDDKHNDNSQQQQPSFWQRLLNVRDEQKPNRKPA